MISKDTIDEIKRIDIVDGISGYLSLKKRGESYVSICPFHEETTPSFVVSPKKNIFHCFGCGESGDLIDFVMKYRNCGFTKACHEISKYYRINIGSESDPNYIPRKTRLQLWEEKVIMRMADGKNNISEVDKQRIKTAQSRINKINQRYNLT